MEREEIIKMIISLCDDMGSPLDLSSIDEGDIGSLGLSSDMNLDTVDRLELLFGLQDSVSEDITVEGLDECETIDDVCDYILSLTS